MQAIKYKENALWKIAGLGWLIVAIVNIGILIFLISIGVKVFSWINIEIFTIIILGILQGIYWLSFKNIDYIRVSDNTLSVYKGLLSKRKVISLKDISEGRKLNNRFVLILHTSKEVEFKLDLMKVKDMDALINHMTSKIHVS